MPAWARPGSRWCWCRATVPTPVCVCLIRSTITGWRFPGQRLSVGEARTRISRRSVAICFSPRTPTMCAVHWTRGLPRRPFCPVVPAVPPARNCASPSMVTRCCFPMSRSGSIRPVAWKPFRPVNVRQHENRCAVVRSRGFWLHSMPCNGSFPKTVARSARPW
ncbi:hypothetical protein D3C75_1022820 [compost metagenome]